MILLVGLNNCLELNSIDTIAKQFGILVTKARKIFPNAEIFIPLVQISERQDHDVQRLARGVNLFIGDRFRVLKGVKDSDFKVQRDSTLDKNNSFVDF